MAKILVIGPGALGAMLGAVLQQRGHEVAFVGRSGPLTLDYTLDHGQQAGMAPGKFTYRFPAPGALFCADVELVLIAVKAFNLQQALSYSDLAPPSAGSCRPLTHTNCPTDLDVTG